jgi:hypothetical protein
MDELGNSTAVPSRASRIRWPSVRHSRRTHRRGPGLTRRMPVRQTPNGISGHPASELCGLSCGLGGGRLSQTIDRQQLADELGGGRGIRTPDTVSRTAVFKTAAINHSAIPPRLRNYCAIRTSVCPLIVDRPNAIQIKASATARRPCSVAPRPHRSWLRGAARSDRGHRPTPVQPRLAARPTFLSPASAGAWLRRDRRPRR